MIAKLSEILAGQSKDAIARAHEEALTEISELRQKIASHPTNPHLYSSLAKLYERFGKQAAAKTVLRSGIEVCPWAAGLYWHLADSLAESGQTEEVIELASAAIEKMPHGLQFRFLQRLTLPVLYESEEEIVSSRQRYVSGLQACENEIFRSTPDALNAFLDGLGEWSNFYLAYQGYDDLELQTRYGSLVSHVMRACYPQWTGRLSMPKAGADGVRVGYFSSLFRNHTVAKLFVGWLENHDRRQFTVFSYYSDRRQDFMTQRIRKASDVFHHIPDDFEAMCRQILSDRLHVLIFTDIGMSSKTTKLAALRLAPVQCMAWGHPVTSGLPSIDYFLSSELMEPAGAQRYYSEKLVLLPGIGICFDKPVIPRAILTKDRTSWGIPEDAIVYLCCQSLFKYLPRHDSLFPDIAQRAGKAKFVFLAPGDVPRDRFWARLERAFAARSLQANDYCLMLPRQGIFDYWSLNLISDVFLDSLVWSGGMTSLDALACALPIVTLPGQFMRSRHASAMLTQLGLTETIASSESDYVDIAARLGSNKTWRKALVRRITDSYGKLYSDVRSVRALEEFLQDVVAAHVSGRAC